MNELMNEEDNDYYFSLLKTNIIYVNQLGACVACVWIYAFFTVLIQGIHTFM